MRNYVVILAVVGLSTVTSSTYGIDILVDNFDDPNNPAWTSITPAPGALVGVGRMFESAKRSDLLAGGRTLPFAMSDDTLFSAAGNSPFPGDTQGVFGQNKLDGFFGVVDTIDSGTTQTGNPSGNGSVEWTVNISGLSDLGLIVDVGAMGDFEETTTNADVYTFSVSIDGGAFVQVMKFGADNAGSHTYRLLDSQTPAADFDLSGTVDDDDLDIWEAFYGLSSGATKLDGNASGDGAVSGIDFLIWQRLFGDSGETATTLNDPLYYLGTDGVLGGGDDVVLDKSDRDTGALDTFMASIAGSGASMTIRFDARTDATSEAFAFDNLIITGSVAEISVVPEPATLVLCGLALAPLGLRRRRS